MELKNIKAEDIMKFVVSMGIPFVAAFLGSMATNMSVNEWYLTLAKPGFTPSGAVIGTVWTVLYVLMGLSLFLVWKKWRTTSEFKLAIMIFSAQLTINVFWSFAFFGLQAPSLGLLTILLLIPVVGFMIYKFYRIDRWAAYLNVPYFLWVCFATILNLAIVVLN